MNLSNAIKKLAKDGWKAEGEQGKPFWHFGKGKCLISLGCNQPQDGDRTVVMIESRKRTDRDEIETDYHAGTFCKSLAAAIRLCEHMEN